MSMQNVDHRLSFLVAVLVCAPVLAQVFPDRHLYPDERPLRPGVESFGTLVEEPDIIDLGNWPSLPREPADRVLPSELEAAIFDYENLIENGEYSDLVAVAEQLPPLVSQLLGEDQEEYSIALSDLGAAYLHAGRPAEAIRPLELSIHQLEKHAGLFAEDLIGPLAYLGMAYQQTGEHRDAVNAFTRSQHITHRLHGAENPYQIKMVYAKAESWIALDEHFEAEQMLRFAVRLAESYFGETSADAMPSRYRLARWLRNEGEFKKALTEYRTAILALTDAEGKDMPEIVPALRGRAMTFLLQGERDVDRGLTLHQRIVDLMQQQPDAFSINDRVAGHVDLGDWLLLFGREEEAWRQYNKAWNLSMLDPDRDWKAWFSEPRMIYAGPNLSLDSMGYGVIGEKVYYDFEFAIREDGRPRKVRILDGNLHGTTRRQAAKFMRSAVFRPPILEGSPVETDVFRIRRFYPTTPPDDYGFVGMGAGCLSEELRRLTNRRRTRC